MAEGTSRKTGKGEEQEVSSTRIGKAVFNEAVDAKREVDATSSL